MNDAEIAATVDTVVAWAYRQAEERKAQERHRAEREAARLEAEARAFHVYDPRPYVEAEPDPALYADIERPLAVKADGTPWGRTNGGTGIGALYGLPGCAHFLDELGDWTLGKEPA